MKKIFALVLGIILSFAMFGCDQVENDSQTSESTDTLEILENDTQETVEDETQEALEDDTAPILFDIVLQKSDTEDYGIIEDDNAVDWGATVFQDASAQQEMEITILGNKYELEYLESAYLPLNAYPVHAYKIKGTEYSKVIISAETNKVVEYCNIPIDVSYSTEQEYISFIQDFIGQSFDLKEYQYKCTTWHYIFSENAMRSRVEDGFHVCTENEKWNSYSFYFDKEVNGIKTLEHISVEFFEDSFYIEMYDFNYEDNVYIQILSMIDSLQESLNEYIKSNVVEDYVITNVDVIDNTLFIRNGLPYIQSRINVEFSYKDEDESMVQLLSTIAGLIQENSQ